MSGRDLLDPKNDYVFKRLFGEAPELLVALINDLRPDLPEILAVEVLNPGIRPEDLSGKYILLDVLARDAAGRRRSSFRPATAAGLGAVRNGHWWRIRRCPRSAPLKSSIPASVPRI